MADMGILGADAVRGNPDGLDAVSRFLRSTADDLHTVRSTLERHAFGDVWEGAAANAFRELLRGTPDDLGQAASSYDLASETVARYAGRLRTAHDTAQALADRLAERQAQAGQAGGAAHAAQQAVDAARRAVAHAVDPAAQAQARHALDVQLRALADAQGRHDALLGQAEAIRRQAADNRRTLEAAGQLAGGDLVRASHLGMRNSVGSWLRRHDAVLGKVEHAALAGLKIAAKTLVDAYELFPALIAYFKDPSWAKLSEVLDHLSAALTVLAIVATVAAVVLTGGAALAALPEVIMALKIGIAATDTTKLGVDAYRRTVLHDRSVSGIDLGMDALAIFGDTVDARAFDARSGGWIHGIHAVDSTNWQTWAAKCAIVGGGQPLSWGALHDLERTLPRTLIVDQAKEGVRDTLRDQAADLGEDYLPVVGRPDDLGPVKGLLHSAATQVKHTLRVPRLMPPVSPQTTAGGAW